LIKTFFSECSLILTRYCQKIGDIGLEEDQNENPIMVESFTQVDELEEEIRPKRTSIQMDSLNVVRLTQFSAKVQALKSKMY
jgi:hypothetical protein